MSGCCLGQHKIGTRQLGECLCMSSSLTDTEGTSSPHLKVRRSQPVPLQAREQHLPKPSVAPRKSARPTCAPIPDQVGAWTSSLIRFVEPGKLDEARFGSAARESVIQDTCDCQSVIGWPYPKTLNRQTPKFKRECVGWQAHKYSGLHAHPGLGRFAELIGGYGFPTTYSFPGSTHQSIPCQ